VIVAGLIENRHGHLVEVRQSAPLQRQVQVSGIVVAAAGLAGDLELRSQIRMPQIYHERRQRRGRRSCPGRRVPGFERGNRSRRRCACRNDRKG
jgi:hypothetical protein